MYPLIPFQLLRRNNIGTAIQLFLCKGQEMDGHGTRPILVVFFRIIGKLKLRVRKNDFLTLGNSDWQTIPLADGPPSQSPFADAEVPFVLSRLLFEQTEPGLPSASTGGAPKRLSGPRRLSGDICLPPLPPPQELPPTNLPDSDTGQQEVAEEHSPSMERPGDGFPSVGGGGYFLPRLRCPLMMMIFCL